jgi:DNA-nicking Smr family endonuclease
LAGKKNREKPFQNSPFKNLKGFSVSATSKGKKSTNEKPPPVPGEDGPKGEVLFGEEMARLGVQRMSGGGEGEGDALSETKDRVSGERPSPKEESSPPATDEELFLDALGRMDVSFKDEVPAGEEPMPRTRLMKQVRQGKREPEATLDLHGCTREEARQKVQFFLEDSVYQGKKTVLVVTGRGRRSAAEPVIRTEVERYLASEAQAWVSEWGRAPRHYGGEGALVVFLRRRT